MSLHCNDVSISFGQFPFSFPKPHNVIIVPKLTQMSSLYFFFFLWPKLSLKNDVKQDQSGATHLIKVVKKCKNITLHRQIATRAAHRDSSYWRANALRLFLHIHCSRSDTDTYWRFTGATLKLATNNAVPQILTPINTSFALTQMNAQMSLCYMWEILRFDNRHMTHCATQPK